MNGLTEHQNSGGHRRRPGAAASRANPAASARPQGAPWRERFTPLGWLFYCVGLQAEYLFVLAGRRVWLALRWLRWWLHCGARTVRHECGRFFAAVWEDICAPWRQLRIGLGNMCTVIREERAYGGSPAGAGAAYFVRGVRSYHRLFWRAAAYVLPVGALAVFLFTVHIMTTSTFALRVEYRGEVVGFIAHESVCDEAYADILARVEGAGTKEDWHTRPEYTLTIVDSAALYSSDELANRIIQTSASEFRTATGVYVNGDLIGVTDASERIASVLEGEKAVWLAGHEDDPAWRVEFQQDVQLKKGLYFTNTLIPMGRLLARLHGEEAVTLPDGTVQAGVDLLGVQTIQQVTRVVDVVLPEQVIEDDTLAWGDEVVDQEAQTGRHELHEEVVYVGGEEVSRTQTSEPTVLVEAKAKITRHGVYNPYGGTAGDAATGEFAWPVPEYRYISRWAQASHRGADIVAYEGTTIIAADNGIVEVATDARGTALWSYGKFVKIDHGNGFATLYAHCSELLVQQGDYVVKGQPIARVGSTGRSTGPHCHFEIQINGKWTDTREYVMPEE